MLLHEPISYLVFTNRLLGYFNLLLGNPLFGYSNLLLGNPLFGYFNLLLGNPLFGYSNLLLGNPLFGYFNLLLGNPLLGYSNLFRKLTRSTVSISQHCLGFLRADGRRGHCLVRHPLGGCYCGFNLNACLPCVCSLDIATESFLLRHRRNCIRVCNRFSGRRLRRLGPRIRLRSRPRIRVLPRILRASVPGSRHVIRKRCFLWSGPPSLFPAFTPSHLAVTVRKDKTLIRTAEELIGCLSRLPNLAYITGKTSRPGTCAGQSYLSNVKL